MAPEPKKAKKGKTKNTDFRRFKATPAARAASSLLSPAIRAKGFAQAEVVTRWPQIVGPELAGSCVPQRLIFPRGERMGAKLIVRCESAFAPLLQVRTQHVIDMVNRFFGFGAVAKLEIQHGPIKTKRRLPQKQKRPLNEDENERLSSLVGKGELSPLQEALKSLGEVVLSNETDKKR